MSDPRLKNVPNVHREQLDSIKSKKFKDKVIDLYCKIDLGYEIDTAASTEIEYLLRNKLAQFESFENVIQQNTKPIPTYKGVRLRKVCGENPEDVAARIHADKDNF